MVSTRVAALLALALALGACTGSPAPDYSVMGALEQVPADIGAGEPLIIVSADVGALADRKAVELPVPIEDDAAEERWLQELLGGGADSGGPYVPLPPNWKLAFMAHEEMQEELGWSWLDVTSFVDAKTIQRPAEDLRAFARYTVVTTAGDVTIPPSATTLDSGLAQVGTAEETLQDHSAARPQGGPRFMRVRNHDVAVGLNERDVRAWPDDGVSLADHDGLAAVAEVLDEVDALTARLTREDFALADSVAAHDALGVAEHVVDGRLTLRIAHHFPDADPDEQLDELRTLWESLHRPGDSSPLGIEVVDSGTDGAVAWLTAHPGDDHDTGAIQGAMDGGFDSHLS